MRSDSQTAASELDALAPGSPDGQRFEADLQRYFGRLYSNIDARGEKTLHALGFRTDCGPMLQEASALMAAHYDAPDALFDSFLDRTYRAYSMAYYGDDATAVQASRLTLEEAQTEKFRLICERADIQDGQSILNIGCGFGSFETYVLERYPNARIVGITASEVQADFIHARCRNPEDVFHQGQFRVIKAKLDELMQGPVERGTYDRVVSIGVLEHMRNMQALLSLNEQLLRPGGKSFHHFITSRYPVPQFLDSDKTRIGRYFPGGVVWPRDALVDHCDCLEPVQQWFVNGMNYWRTLDEWHRRFWSARDQLLATCLDIDQFKHWNEYFYLCKAMFSPLEGTFYGNSHYLFRKPH
jgi:cyclopropane-fatty-acyl-phospholipid synthase